MFSPIDLHAGGYSLNFVPYISMQYLEDERQRAATLAAVHAFQAPVSMIIKEIGGEGLMDYEVESMGKIFLCAEMAGAGMFSRSALKMAETGIRNLLVHFGLQSGEILTRESQGQPPPITMEIPAMDYYSLAPSSGIFEPFFQLGEWIKSGEHLGQVHSLEHVFGELSLVSAQRSGRILISRAPGRVEVGDCLVVIARQSDGLGDPL